MQHVALCVQSVLKHASLNWYISDKDLICVQALVYHQCPLQGTPLPHKSYG